MVEQREAADELGTGAMVWAAGPDLAKALFLADERSTVGSASLRLGEAIELGCGCSGLPGVALSLAGMGSVVLTDAAQLMQALRRNLEAYALAAVAQKQLAASQRIRDVRTLPLSWDDADTLAVFARGAGFRVVLCADVEYADTLHHALLNAVRCSPAATQSMAHPLTTTRQPPPAAALLCSSSPHVTTLLPSSPATTAHPPLPTHPPPTHHPPITHHHHPPASQCGARTVHGLRRHFRQRRPLPAHLPPLPLSGGRHLSALGPLVRPAAAAAAHPPGSSGGGLGGGLGGSLGGGRGGRPRLSRLPLRRHLLLRALLAGR